MYTIGILGGVASGKSLVTRQLAELGAGVLDADQAGHETLDDQEVREALRKRWGNHAFTPDGRVDRKRIAEIVFSPSSEGDRERQFLEELVHPRIAKRLADRRKELAAEEYSVVVLDAPLILEAGWDRLCNRLVFVDATRELRLARAAARGWSEEDVARREAAQLPLEVKRARADVTIDNSGTPQQTKAQIEQFWKSLAEQDNPPLSPSA
ncbi:MAG: dephospho-CoA kinase [Thermoguttaceae bacterium]|jgi:dephospho-CoA kinase|nr:dephospho-CoA kinase [Thermoguttaceae bacterium]